MNKLEMAIALACKVHAGQVDKAGQPYILHPLRLMLKFQSENEKIVAVLHDVVEDGDVTLEELRQNGFPETVVIAIDSLSKKLGESYEDFIIRLSSSELAKRVKIEDIKDNLDINRLTSLTDEDLQRISKYHRALKYLMS